jgi:hypothetical protein
MKAIFFIVIALFSNFAHAQFTAGTSFGNELGNLDFESIIGGPFNAVIKSQANAATTTVEFLDSVAFQTVGAEKHMRTVQFSYESFNNGTVKNFSMSIPLLTIVPIPYIQFDNIDLDFNVKLNSMASSERTSEFKVNTEFGVEGRAGWLIGPKFNFKTTVSNQVNTRQYGEEKREYSLNVKVRASQAPLPAGTSRLLDLMESVIRDGIEG